MFFNTEFLFNIKYKGKLIQNFENLSDGEKNAIHFINFYLDIITSKTNKNILILLDDSCIGFDKNNWISLVEILKEFYNFKDNITMIIFSHDSAFINMCEKIFSNTFNTKFIKTMSLYLFEENIENNNFTYFKWKDKKTMLMKIIHSAFLKGNLDNRISSLLHYNEENTIKKFCNELGNYNPNTLISNYGLENITENNNIFLLFEKLIEKNKFQENEKINFKIYHLFYIRMKIEKFCYENSENIKTSVITKNTIKNSKLDNITKEKLISIYNYLPHYLHVDFFDFSFYFDLSSSRIEFLENKIDEIIKNYKR